MEDVDNDDDEDDDGNGDDSVDDDDADEVCDVDELTGTLSGSECVLVTFECDDENGRDNDEEEEEKDDDELKLFGIWSICGTVKLI